MKRLMLFLICLLSMASIVAHAEDAPGKVLTPTQVFEKYAPSVVLIIGLAEDKASTVLGTGFLVTSSGVFVTNYHVIQGIFPAQVKLSNGDAFDNLMIVDTDERKDIAVLKVKGFKLPAVTLGDSDAVKPGDKITVIGNPKGLEGSVTDGLVSAVRDIKDIVPAWDGYKAMQISAAISPGSSGSPVFDENGRVIAIASATLKDGQNLNFAIPINYARGMISEKEKMSLEEFSKTSKPPLIGPSTTKLTVDNDEWGKRMASVIHKTYEALDNALFGDLQTLEPHSKGYNPVKFFISSSFYIAESKLATAASELAGFVPADSSLKEFHLRMEQGLPKYSQAVSKHINIWKTVQKEGGFYTYNASMGEVNALISDGNDALKLFRFFEVYKKYCPNEVSLLPMQFRLDFTQLPVRLGFMGWVSRDDVVIMNIEPKSAAEKADLKPGDIIIGIENGVRFNTWEDWFPYMRTRKPGDEVSFEVLRNGEKKILKAKLMPRQE